MELTREYFDTKLGGLATKEGLAAVHQEVSSLRIEVGTFHQYLEEIKKSLAELTRRDREDSDAFARDIVELKGRVAALEKIAEKLTR